MNSESCEEDQGYLEFGEFYPKELLGYQFRVAEGAIINLDGLYKKINSWDTSEGAMEACLKG